ncbi:MAG: hypothetical protein R3F31_02695 [Verrucomicrobiales bacterium]
MDSGYIVLILFTLLVGILFHQAWQGHSESILTGFFAVLGGILVAWVFYHFLAPLLDSRVGVMSLKQRILSSGVLGLGGWAALRGPAATFPRGCINREIPSIFVPMDLRPDWSPAPSRVGAGFPPLPVPALGWDGVGIEELPNPLSSQCLFPCRDLPALVRHDRLAGWMGIPSRRGGGLQLGGRHRPETPPQPCRTGHRFLQKTFFHQLGEDPETAPLLNNAAFQGLLEDPGILALREARDSLGLIASPRLQAASLDRELKVLLTVVNLRNAADRFFLSDHWQGTVKQEKVANQVIRAAEKENGR